MAISIFALLASLASIAINYYQFHYIHLRRSTAASISIVGVERQIFRKGDEPVMTVRAIVANSGTTSFAIQQVGWILSQHIDPVPQSQRLIQWVYRPRAAVMFAGESVSNFEFAFAAHDTALDDLQEAARFVMSETPAVLRREPNFQVDYCSSLVFLVADAEGELHEVVAPMGSLGFRGEMGTSMHALALGDFRELPTRIKLLPSRTVRGFGDMMRIWMPCAYYNFGNSTDAETDTTGWRFYSDHARAVFDSLAQSGTLTLRH